MADAGGRRKPYIFFFQCLVAVGCFTLWWAYPHRPDLVSLISWAVVVATIGAEMSIVFNNSLLPTIVRPERMGRLSGFGWGLGYCGGLLALFAVLIVSRPSMFGLAANDQPLFGLDPETYTVERLVGPASVVWLALFVIPMFLFTPDGNQQRRLSLVDAAKDGGRALLHTVVKLRHYRNALLYLLAFMLYNDGLAAIIAFGGIYAAAIFGWDTVTIGIFGIIVTIFAIPGAFLGGWVDDRIGSKRTVQLAVLGVIIATIGIVSLSKQGVFFFVSAPELSADARPVRLAAGAGVHGLRAAPGLLHGADAGGEPHHDRPAGARGHDRRVLRPVRPVGAGHGLDGAARHRHRHHGDAIQSAGRGVRAVLPGARLRAAAGRARGAHRSPRRDRMITAIVNFKLPADIDARKAAELFKGSAPKYRGMKGLVRKYYLFDDKSRIGGGVYLWKTRADAEAVYTPQWQDYIADRYGAAPDIRYFETAVVVDNESDKILADAA